MPRKERHDVPISDRGGWDSKRENAERASKHFETKKDAIDWSRPKAKQEGSELIPHGKDGKIQNPKGRTNRKTDKEGNSPYSDNNSPYNQSEANGTISDNRRRYLFNDSTSDETKTTSYANPVEF